MPRVEAAIFKKKGEKRVLRIQLDEGESIRKAIPKAMLEHGIEVAKVVEINGTLKELLINFFESGKFASKKLYDTKILRAHGTVKQNFGEMFGGVNVSIGLKPPVGGTLVNAIAGKDAEIVLNFIEIK